MRRTYALEEHHSETLEDAKALVGTARRSWLLGVYKGVSGLWPFGGGTEGTPPQALGKPTPADH